MYQTVDRNRHMWSFTCLETKKKEDREVMTLNAHRQRLMLFRQKKNGQII